ASGSGGSGSAPAHGGPSPHSGGPSQGGPPCLSGDGGPGVRAARRKTAEKASTSRPSGTSRASRWAAPDRHGARTLSRNDLTPVTLARPAAPARRPGSVARDVAGA